MPEPIWIHKDIVLAIHSRQIAEHGGLSGIRDLSLLESALAGPLQVFHYTNPKPTIPNLAANYAYGIAKNHPFNDGNKRVAFVVCQLFVRLNGFQITASKEEKYRIFLGLADGKITLDELALRLQEHSSPSPK